VGKTVDELVDFSRTVEGQGTEDNGNCTYKEAELRALASQVAALRKGARVLEIGVFTGRSASLYFQVQKELELDLHLCDLWSWNVHFCLPIFNKLVYDNFNEVPFTLHKMFSHLLGEKWTLPLDLIHIDGYHDMPGIEPDCRLFLPHVVSGGVAVFHDIDYGCVAECIDRFVRPAWTLVEEAQRTGVWRKN
jgi:predicted O-methyltransferase YrrM